MKASSFNGRRQCQEDDRAIEVGQETVVKLLYPRCGILVVQGHRVLACVRIQDEGGPAHDEVRTFAMQPAELAMLSDWLAAHDVTHVAIDSPKPSRQTLFHALQPAFTALEIEAGRVADDGDIGRIASLLAYGLETYRVVPPIVAAGIRASPETSVDHGKRGDHHCASGFLLALDIPRPDVFRIAAGAHACAHGAVAPIIRIISTPRGAALFLASPNVGTQPRRSTGRGRTRRHKR